jgi:hypothetical protein
MNPAPGYETATRTTWEYRLWSPGMRAALSDDRLQTQLSELGAEGWELVAIEGQQYFFKRPR